MRVTVAVLPGGGGGGGGQWCCVCFVLVLDADFGCFVVVLCACCFSLCKVKYLASVPYSPKTPFGRRVAWPMVLSTF